MRVYVRSGIADRAQTHVMLERAMADAWGLSPQPCVVREEGGKPRLRDFPEHHFNLSHSADHALCALDDAPVGTDIQIIRRDLRTALPARVCSDKELDWLNEQGDYWAAFTRLWCLKEARVKFTGAGIGAGLRTTAVPLPEGEVGLYRLEGLWFRLYDLPGFACAVCGKNPPPEEMIRL